MTDIYTEGPRKLELQIAARMDLESIISVKYELKGERLEMLLTFSELEAISRIRVQQQS